MHEKKKTNHRITAERYFHTTPNNWNCAQSIIKARQDIVSFSDDEIELYYRSKGGGRAEGGICGAVYAATEMLSSDAAEHLRSKVLSQLGGLTCQCLKGEKKIPCTQIVKLVDDLLDEELQNK